MAALLQRPHAAAVRLHCCPSPVATRLLCHAHVAEAQPRTNCLALGTPAAVLHLRQLGAGASGSGAAASRRPCQPCSAAPVSLFQLADAEVIFEATGVPLVDELMKLGSVAAAAHRSLHLLAVLAGVALVGTLVLRAADAAADRRIRGATTFNVGAALVAAAYRPCKVMLPLYCAARAVTVVLALAEVAATKLQADPASLLLRCVDGRLLHGLRWCTLAAGAGSTWDVQLTPVLQLLAQLGQDCSELVLVVAVAWVAMRFKLRVFAWQASCIQLDNDPHNDAAVPLLRLASSAVGVLIVLAALGITLVGLGFHIGPLLASVGGVGVVLGFASQQLLANLASAVSIFITRPFVTGDQVQLLNPEGVEIDGTVLNIEPTRTILRDDTSGCIVHVNNADVATYVIKNFTQNGDPARLRKLTEGLPSGAATAALRTLPELDAAGGAGEVSAAGGDGGQEEEGTGGRPGGGWRPAPAA